MLSQVTYAKWRTNRKRVVLELKGRLKWRSRESCTWRRNLETSKEKCEERPLINRCDRTSPYFHVDQMIKGKAAHHHLCAAAPSHFFALQFFYLKHFGKVWIHFCLTHTPKKSPSWATIPTRTLPQANFHTHLWCNDNGVKKRIKQERKEGSCKKSDGSHSHFSGSWSKRPRFMLNHFFFIS